MPPTFKKKKKKKKMMRIYEIQNTLFCLCIFLTEDHGSWVIVKKFHLFDLIDDQLIFSVQQMPCLYMC